MSDRPFAVHTTGYHAQHGLIVAVALSLDGLAALLQGKALAFDLREQGLPRGHVVVMAGPEPHALVQALDVDALLGPENAPAPLGKRWACPACHFTLGFHGEAPPPCPNDGYALSCEDVDA